jgi:hypothetical protein
MCIKLKILGAFIAIFISGCSGNSNNKSLLPTSDIKRFVGVVNNASVKGIDLAVIPIGKHGQFGLDEEGNVDASIKKSDDRGRYRFNIDIKEVGSYVLTASTPELTPETESLEMPQASCQLAAGCTINKINILFGEDYSLAYGLQWSAAVESVSDGQFIVVNPITEMARVLGFSIFVNDSEDSGTTVGDIPAASYYSNYGVVKGNSQTASLLGLGDILSIEPVDMTLLHVLSVDSSTAIQESIRYGALLAGWQKLELEYNENLLDPDFPFQAEVISQFIANKGQLYQAAALDNQVLTLKQWYQAALENLVAVRDYHLGLTRDVPSDVNLVITRFQSEINALNDGELTEAVFVINAQFVEDYSDAVMKTKAMVNYLSNLQTNFATEDYRRSIKETSDLVTAETQRLSPKLDGLFKNLLLIHQYYISCNQGICDEQSVWHGEGNTYVAQGSKLTIVQPGGTTLELTQGLVFDELSPEGSTSTNTHDLYLAGAFEFDGLRLELSDLTSDSSEGIPSSFRFSFSERLAKLPLPPELIIGGLGASVNDSLLPNYIELFMPNFKLYDFSQVGMATELSVSGALTAAMIANTDIADIIKEPEQKLGKRYNLSSVRAVLKFTGQDQSAAGSNAERRDNAVISIDAIASEAFKSGSDFTAYFPDTVYPTFESFFKPREGFKVGDTSSAPLVISRKGEMNLPMLDDNGVYIENGSKIKVQYIELDYEVGGLERYVVYPKAVGDDKYWGLICTAQPEDEDNLVDPEYSRVIQNDAGEEFTQVLLACLFRDKYAGEATTDEFVNKIYELNKDLFNLRDYNGQGSYRIDYPTTTAGKLQPFIQNAPHDGKLEKSIVLGVDSMRLQFKPEFVSPSGASYLPESILDISLIWRTHELIDVNALLAFDSEQVINNQNGSGLPYLAVGSDSESYSVAYRTDANGDESGEYVMAWAGVKFVDGPINGSKVMQKTDNVDLKEGLFAGIGSNVTYLPYSPRELRQQDLNGIDGTQATEEKCGFFARGAETQAGEDCDAIAYLTFRGLVTGSLREERDGAYVIRYIDGTWQVLGVQ